MTESVLPTVGMECGIRVAFSGAFSHMCARTIFKANEQGTEACRPISLLRGSRIGPYYQGLRKLNRPTMCDQRFHSG